MCDSAAESYGNRFYMELRRLSGFDFMDLSYEDIQRLKTADQETTYQLMLGHASSRPQPAASPEEFAASFIEWAKHRAIENAENSAAIFSAFQFLGDLGIQITGSIIN